MKGVLVVSYPVGKMRASSIEWMANSEFFLPLFDVFCCPCLRFRLSG
jgi:hypothetical protein